MNYDLIYISIIGFVFLVIIGLYLSQESNLNISEKNKILMENFSPQVSSTNSQKKGASHLYKWGLPEDPADTPTTKKDCEKPDDVPPFTPKPVDDNCPQAEEISCKDSKNEKCGTCDILSHPDINKYVLKSSVPPCPDVSKYATKNMLKTCPDMSKYILKSKIPVCEKIDKSKYILKSEVPACPKCPICPVCPVCPTCPKPQPCKKINQYKIEEHPDMEKYIKKDDVKKFCDKYEEEEQKQKDNKNNIDEESNYTNDEGSIIDGEYAPYSDDDKNGKHKDKCTYPNMLDRIFAQGSNLKKSNSNGLYAGDNLFAKF